MIEDPKMTKGNCTHCGGGLEFDADYAGHMITCPHCGRETILEKPTDPEGSPPPPSTGRKDLFAERQRRDRDWKAIAKYAAILIGVVVLCLLVRAFFDFLGERGSKELLVGLPGVLIGLALFVAALWVAILWIVFPVFVYQYLRRLVWAQEESNRLLKILIEKPAYKDSHRE